jgi:hypothetical protein
VAHDRGAVTVEAALGLGTLAVFLALALGALTAVGQSMRCLDAARELVRLAARGEPERGRAVAVRLAPAGASAELTVDGDLLVGVVSAPVGDLLPVTVRGRSVAYRENGS